MSSEHVLRSCAKKTVAVGRATEKRTKALLKEEKHRARGKGGLEREGATEGEREERDGSQQSCPACQSAPYSAAEHAKLETRCRIQQERSDCSYPLPKLVWFKLLYFHAATPRPVAAALSTNQARRACG
eukprot:6173349-Pleurochrysis_carterae.AAC.6